MSFIQLQQISKMRTYIQKTDMLRHLFALFIAKLYICTCASEKGRDIKRLTQGCNEYPRQQPFSQQQCIDHLADILVPILAKLMLWPHFT